MPLLNPPAPSHARVFVQDVETYDVSPIDPVNDLAVRKRLEAFLSGGVALGVNCGEEFFTWESLWPSY